MPPNPLVWTNFGWPADEPMTMIFFVGAARRSGRKAEMPWMTPRALTLYYAVSAGSAWRFVLESDVVVLGETHRGDEVGVEVVHARTHGYVSYRQVISHHETHKSSKSLKMVSTSMRAALCMRQSSFPPVTSETCFAASCGWSDTQSANQDMVLPVLIGTSRDL